MFKVEINNTEGAAFRDDINGEYDPDARNLEIARILRGIESDIIFGKDHGPCMDINGNRVGSWEIRED